MKAGRIRCAVVAVTALLLSFAWAPPVRTEIRGIADSGATSGSQRPPPSPASPFGVLTSSRWAYGADFVRESLQPVKNPNPAPEPQPHRDHPYDLVVSADGTKVYVALAGSELEPGHEVAVYDVGADRIVRRIDLKPRGQAGSPGMSPYRLALHPGGRFLLVTNRFSNFASVIDTEIDEVVSEIPLDFYCQGVTFDPTGRVAYVSNRYLDQVFVVDIEIDGDRFTGRMRVLGGVDDTGYFEGSGGSEALNDILVRRCGAASCHDTLRGGLVAGPAPRENFLSVLGHLNTAQPERSVLLRAPLGTGHGGYADAPASYLIHKGGVVFSEPSADPDYAALRRWVLRAAPGPGIPVGNPRSKPKLSALGSDGRYLFVGNTGTQDVSIVDTRTLREVGAIYIQNVVNDLRIHHAPENGHDYLLVSTEGVGFGVMGERDPFGGETWDRENPAAHYSVWRETSSGGARYGLTGRVMPREEQEVLGPFDAVDGTASIKFRDIQNDMVVVDVTALDIPETDQAPSYLLLANRYESHRAWVRYTSDTAESTYGDIKGDIPPDLMRVVGSFPEKIAIHGDRLFVSMQTSGQVQAWRIRGDAMRPGADPSDFLVPDGVFATGLQPIGIAAGNPGTPSEGMVYTANFLGGTLSVIDLAGRTSREVVIDPSVLTLPVPATNAERGELFVHSSLWSSDGDTSCFHCHYLDMGDGRPWGVSQVVGQEFIERHGDGQFVIGGTMGVPQMRGLFDIQPFFFEGVISAFEPRSMIMEHCPSDDFLGPTPQGDYTDIRAHYALAGLDDVQSSMTASTAFAWDLEERRDSFFREQSMRYLGKAFVLRDFQRFIGEWQIHEPRLLPNPFDRNNVSVRRGEKLFMDPQVGCSGCHPPPHFAKKDFPDNPQQSMPPVVSLTVRDAAFTLVGMNRLDTANAYLRDLEPWDAGRVESRQGHFTVFPLRGIWERPPVFLHNGLARTLREVVATPGHPALRSFTYPPLVGGEPERSGLQEAGFNETFIFASKLNRVRGHLDAAARLGLDTHGGTLHLRAQQVDDLVNFMQAIE